MTFCCKVAIFVRFWRHKNLKIQCLIIYWQACKLQQLMLHVSKEPKLTTCKTLNRVLAPFILQICACIAERFCKQQDLDIRCPKLKSGGGGPLWKLQRCSCVNGTLFSNWFPSPYLVMEYMEDCFVPICKHVEQLVPKLFFFCGTLFLPFCDL